MRATVCYFALVLGILTPRTLAQEGTTAYERADASLADAAAETDRHADLIASDLLLRNRLRTACYVLLSSTDTQATESAAASIAEAERLLASRAEPSETLSRALTNAKKLVTSPPASRAQISVVIRLLDQQAMDEATENRLLLERLLAMVQRVSASQASLITEQANARRAEGVVE